MFLTSIPKFTVLFALHITITHSQKQKGLIYILQWSCRILEPEFSFLKTKNKSFLSKGCLYENCYFTADRSHLNSILDYDVLIFNIEHLCPTLKIPYVLQHNRSQHQLYVLITSKPTNSAHTFNNDFFNFTWINKRAYSHSLAVKEKNIKGDGFNRINSSILKRLRGKSIAATCIADNQCGQQFIGIARILKRQLSKYGQIVDIYSDRIPCPASNILTDYLDDIESHYYFYLAFKNSFDKVYVSEMVLQALQHLSVPIVFGGTDYTRFLPEGSYVDASKFSEGSLAKFMYEIINDPPRYYEFFRWHNYYSIDGTGDSDDGAVCELCAFLNKKQRVRRSPKYFYTPKPTTYRTSILKDLTPTATEIVLNEEDIDDLEDTTSTDYLHTLLEKIISLIKF